MAAKTFEKWYSNDYVIFWYKKVIINIDSCLIMPCYIDIQPTGLRNTCFLWNFREACFSIWEFLIVIFGRWGIELLRCLLVFLLAIEQRNAFCSSLLVSRNLFGLLFSVRMLFIVVIYSWCFLLSIVKHKIRLQVSISPKRPLILDSLLFSTFLKNSLDYLIYFLELISYLTIFVHTTVPISFVFQWGPMIIDFWCDCYSRRTFFINYKCLYWYIY